MNYRIKHLAGQKKLATLIEHRHAVTIYRDTTPFDDQLSGYLMGYSNDLLLIACYNDFLPTGYKIVPIRDVTDYQYAPEDQFAEFVMKKENLISPPPSCEIDLLSWKAALESLRAGNEEIIVENERAELFAIGQILEVDEDKFSLAPRDGVGKWVKMKLDIAWEDLTSVSFGCNYIGRLVQYGQKTDEQPDWDSLPGKDFDEDNDADGEE